MTTEPVTDYRDVRLPPVPSGGWRWEHFTTAEQSLLRPPAWMRPCRHDHGRA